MTPLGKIKTNPAPHPCKLEVSSTYRVHCHEDGSVSMAEVGCVVEPEMADTEGNSSWCCKIFMNAGRVNSEIKSAMACTFMVVCGWYKTSNSLSSTNHLIRWPKVSGLCKTGLNGWSVMTTNECDLSTVTIFEPKQWGFAWPFQFWGNWFLAYSGLCLCNTSDVVTHLGLELGLNLLQMATPTGILRVY